MRNRGVLRLLILCLVVGITLPAADGKGGARAANADGLPFRCFTDVWTDSFQADDPVYERKTGQISWVLEAKQEVHGPRYEAVLTDPDGVQNAVVEVAFVPKAAVYAKGAKLKAVVTLNVGDPEKGSKLTIRARKRE